MAETETKVEDGGLIERPLNITEEELQRNIANSLRFPQFQPDGQSGAVVICAAGPSLLDEIPFMQAMYAVGVDFCAVKGTADVLISHDIIPKYVVSMDGKEDQLRFFTNPRHDIEYLIAGQTHPKVFDALEGYHVTVWQGQGKKYLPKGTQYVLGGSTSGSRAISLMWAKGYTTHHLVGFDCCELKGKTHVYGVVKEQKLADVYLGMKKYRMTGQMIFQYEEIINNYCRDRRITMVVHGTGVLAEAWMLINDGVPPNLTLFPYSHAA